MVRSAITLHNMANVHKRQGNYGQALELYEESLRVSKAVLGNEHVSVGEWRDRSRVGDGSRVLYLGLRVQPWEV